MNIFRLYPTDVPDTLYRVQYGDSMTTYDKHKGLEADDTDTLYDDGGDEQEEGNTLQQLGDAVERHLNWDNDYRSIFISLFRESTHAENWMLRRHNHFDSRDCKLLHIDTKALHGFFIFRAKKIVDALSLRIREAAQASVAGEYLIAHYIPQDAIKEIQTVNNILQGKTTPF